MFVVIRRIYDQHYGPFTHLEKVLWLNNFQLLEIFDFYDVYVLTGILWHFNRHLQVFNFFWTAIDLQVPDINYTAEEE